MQTLCLCFVILNNVEGFHSFILAFDFSLSIVNCPLSIVNCPVPVIPTYFTFVIPTNVEGSPYLVLAFDFSLSIVNCPLSIALFPSSRPISLLSSRPEVEGSPSFIFSYLLSTNYYFTFPLSPCSFPLTKGYIFYVFKTIIFS